MSKSIIQTKKECWSCQSHYVEEHHIFFGTANRKQSEKYGLKIWLCAECHRTGCNAVHRNNAKNLKYKKMAQKVFEETHTREEFMQIFGKNYLDMEEIERVNIKITIPLLPRSKKNSSQIIKCGNRTMLIPSKLYKEYEKECGYYLKRPTMPIDKPINLKCKFIVPDKRKRDLTNLLNAIQDILVHYGILADDNYLIVQSVDGSRIVYEKGVEKTEIEIREVIE